MLAFGQRPFLFVACALVAGRSALGSHLHKRSEHDALARKVSRSAHPPFEPSKLHKRDLGTYKGGDGSEYNVLYTGNGDNTYYWDLAASNQESVCYAAQPAGPWVFSESTALTECESVATSLQKTMAQKGNLKMVAIQAEYFQYDWCGKEIVVTVDGKDFADYILWDVCQNCTGGLDFSVTEFHNMYGDAGCVTGRYHNVAYHVLDHNTTGTTSESDMWQPRLLTKGINAPAYIDKHSNCSTAQLNNYTCSTDGSHLLQCAPESNPLNASLTGTYQWIPQPCAPGTFCDPNLSTGYPVCVAQAEASSEAAPAKCGNVNTGGYQCAGNSGTQLCQPGSTQGTAAWAAAIPCPQDTTCFEETIGVGIAQCIAQDAAT